MFRVYSFLQLYDHIDILRKKIRKFQKWRKNLFCILEGWGTARVSKRGKTKFSKVVGETEMGEQDFLKKLEGGPS